MAAIFLTVVAAVAWRLWEDSQAPEEEEDPGQTAASEPQRPFVASAELFSADSATPVVGAEVVRDTLWIRVAAAGMARATRIDTLAARLTGPLARLLVSEGQLVSGGQALAVIDTVEAASELATARLALLEARTRYDAVMAAGRDSDSEETRARRARFAAVQTGLEQRRTDLAKVELKMSHATVRAPFEGRIADIGTAPGEWVNEGDRIMTVVDMDPLEVEVQVPEVELPKLAEGRGAKASFAALPGQEFGARVVSVNPVVDPRERTGRVVVGLPNPGGRIFPGMFARVLLDVEALPDRLIVPRAALLQRSETLDRHVVFVLLREGEHAVSDWRYVNPGRESDTHVELLAEGPEEGIVLPGEIVLVDGHHYLSHGTRVRLVDNVAAAGGRPTR